MIELLNNFKFYIILGLVLIFLTFNLSNIDEISWNTRTFDNVSNLFIYQQSSLLNIKLYFWHTLCLMIIGYGFYIKPKK